MKSSMLLKNYGRKKEIMINKNLKRICLTVLSLLLCMSLVSCKDSGLKKIKVAEVAHSVFYAPQYVVTAFYLSNSSTKYALEYAFFPVASTTVTLI